VSFDQGITATVEWYKQNESWWKRIISKEYLDSNRAEANEQ